MAQAHEPSGRYHRLVKRLYEAIFLLQRLDPPLRPHTITQHDPLGRLATQQRFLKTLAFMIDSNKGGATTAAIAVEETTQDLNFIIAVNDQSRKERAKTILQDYLHNLFKILAFPTAQYHERGDEILLRRITHFSKTRLRKELKLLELTARKCMNGHHDPPLSSGLMGFLRALSKESGSNLALSCQQIHSAERDPMFDRARQLGRDPDDGSNPPADVMNFKKLVHYVYRVSAHLRAVKRLIDDGARLKTFLEHYRVTSVGSQARCPLPEIDEPITIDGILRRILPANDPRHEAMEAQLQHIDEQTGLEKWIQDRFAPEETDKGSIHCEVQLLEHFHQNKLRFASDDRYVACSKPSCVCCELYFRHHPLQCAQLDTHGRLYRNWAPPLLVGGVKDVRWSEQRHILGEMAHALGDLVISRLERLHVTAGNGARFDSLDGNTVSGADFDRFIHEEDLSGDEGSSIDSDDIDSDEPGGALL